MKNNLRPDFHENIGENQNKFISFLHRIECFIIISHFYTIPIVINLLWMENRLLKL